jgi:hypothetical protein
MKKIIFLCALLISASSCTKNFDNLNTNPSQFASPDPESIMTGVFKATADRFQNNNTTYFWEYSHLIEPSSGQRYNTGGTDSGPWNDLYLKVLGNIRQLKNVYGTNTLYANRVAIANIWECYVYGYLVGTYGPIGYSNAGKASPVVLYDDENTVYASLLSRLKDAAAAINPTGDKPTTDIIYGGDLTKWVKFAHTLRLQLALRCQRNLPAESVAAIKEEMSNESMLMQSDADDPKLTYGTTDGSQSVYWQQFIKNEAAAIAPTQTGGPEMSDYVFTYFRSYNDPRMGAYFNKAVTAPAVVKDTLTSTSDALHYVVTYAIPYMGSPKAATLLSTWNTPGSGVPFSGLTHTVSYATLPGLTQLPINTTSGVNLLAPDRPFYFMTYAEVCFMKAEASALGYGGTQTADQYYYAGINANFAFWGLSAAAATAYEAQNGIKWNTAGHGFNYDLGFINTSIPNNNLTRIWIQEWINYFDDGCFDAWCLQRRTQNLALPPHTNSSSTLSAVYADLPDRWTYPVTAEVAVNPTGIADAVKKLGANDLSTTVLKFAAPYTHVNWNAAHQFIDDTFVEKWYGTTIQSTAAGLAAAGLKPYTLLSTY